MLITKSTKQCTDINALLNGSEQATGYSCSSNPQEPFGQPGLDLKAPELPPSPYHRLMINWKNCHALHSVPNANESMTRVPRKTPTKKSRSKRHVNQTKPNPNSHNTSHQPLSSSLLLSLPLSSSSSTILRSTPFSNKSITKRHC